MSADKEAICFSNQNLIRSDTYTSVGQMFTPVAPTVYGTNSIYLLYIDYFKLSIGYFSITCSGLILTPGLMVAEMETLLKY